MANEVIANSPVPGKREPVGTLAVELALGAKGAKALKLAATIAKRTGLRVAGVTHLLVGPSAAEGELITITTAIGEPTEYEILERAVEESTEKAWPVGTKVWAALTRGQLLAWALSTLAAELEAHGFTKWQAKEVVAALAKGGNTLTLASYAGNEVAKIVLADSAMNVFGPILFLGNATFFAALTVAVLKVHAISYEAGFETLEATALGTVALCTSESKERSTYRINPRHVGGCTVGGLLAPGVEEFFPIRILNEGPEPLKFLHQAAEVETELGVKTAVPAANRLILSKGEGFELKTNGVAEFFYDASLQRWHGWLVSV